MGDVYAALNAGYLEVALLLTVTRMVIDTNKPENITMTDLAVIVHLLKIISIRDFKD